MPENNELLMLQIIKTNTLPSKLPLGWGGEQSRGGGNWITWDTLRRCFDVHRVLLAWRLNPLRGSPGQQLSAQQQRTVQPVQLVEETPNTT